MRDATHLAPTDDAGSCNELPKPADARQISDDGARAHSLSIGSQSIEAYTTWDAPAVRDPRDTAIFEIADRMSNIIDVEGPMLLERAFHLYANAAGIRRVGPQLRSLFLGAAERALSSGKIEEVRGQRNLDLDSVVRRSGSPPVALRNRGPRSFDEIPKTEVAEAMQSIMNAHPSLRFDELCRKVLDFYDLTRLTENVRKSLTAIASNEGNIRKFTFS